MNDFDLLLRHLSERLASPHGLPVRTDGTPQAAVTIILREIRNDAEMLIIKRAECEGDPWSGHLALPGGRVDAADVDLMATAARETQEEIGINLFEGGLFIGALPIINIRNPRLPDLDILPFVAIAPAASSVRLNGEVAAIYWVSINQLRRDGASIEYRFKHDDLIFRRPAYPSAGGLIWGITERILTSFLSLLD